MCLRARRADNRGMPDILASFGLAFHLIAEGDAELWRIVTLSIGVSLASRLFQRISHELLLRLVAVLLLATGGSLIVRALG